jgi:Protein of unknown function (DUF2569)
MDDFTTPIGSHAVESMQPGSLPGTTPRTGVGGWLLVLCLMFTVVGPLISAWLLADEYAAFEPYFAGSAGLQAAIFVSLAITACSVAFGIYAGLRLWLIRPNAVTTTKHALLVGLAADAVTTAIGLVAGPTPDAQGQLLRQLTIDLVPSFIFFTLCFAYLNRSRRVYATYLSNPKDA